MIRIFAQCSVMSQSENSFLKLSKLVPPPNHFPWPPGVSLFLQLHIPLFMQKFTWSWVSSWKADSKVAVMYRFLFFLNFVPFARDLISLLSPVSQSILHYHIWTSARRLPQLMEVLGPCLTLPNSQPRDTMNGQVPTFHTLDWYQICKFKFLGQLLGTY